ncbi:MAG: hypothetical protein PHV87_07940 [Bacilli bacterium]|nr:hypothetical protein [Bacilli bacterium]
MRFQKIKSKLSKAMDESTAIIAFRSAVIYGESLFENDDAEVSASGLMGIVLVAVMAAYALPIAINAFTNTTYEDPMFESMKIIIPLAIFGGVAIGFMKGWI